MIIPGITWAENDEIGIEKKYIEHPHYCPICGEPTWKKKENNSEVLYCDNPNCQGKLINIIDHMLR